MCRDVNGDGTWGGVVLGAVREVAQGLVQGVVEEVVLGVDTNFGIILSTKASRTPPPLFFYVILDPFLSLSGHKKGLVDITDDPLKPPPLLKWTSPLPLSPLLVYRLTSILASWLTPKLMWLTFSREVVGRRWSDIV